MKIGSTINKYIKLKDRISKKAKEIDELKKQAKEIEFVIIKDLNKQGTVRADVDMGSVTLKEIEIGIVKDWPAVYAEILKTGSWDLMEKRLGQAAFRERLADGILLEGVEKMTRSSLTVGRKRR